MGRAGLAELFFTSKEVRQITGITARQLQWWDERGLIRAGRQGYRRAFRSEDVIGMLLVDELRRKGLSLQKIRRLVRRLRQDISRQWDELYEAGADRYLLTDGEALYWEGTPEGVVERLNRHRRPMWLVSLSEQVARLRAFEKGAERSVARSLGKRQPDGQLSLFG